VRGHHDVDPACVGITAKRHRHGKQREHSGEDAAGENGMSPAGMDQAGESIERCRCQPVAGWSRYAHVDKLGREVCAGRPPAQVVDNQNVVHKCAERLALGRENQLAAAAGAAEVLFDDSLLVEDGSVLELLESDEELDADSLAVEPERLSVR
jgi:hypothetical protein